MPLEPGGPAGGGGFYYQHSLVVMYLAQMLSTGTQSPGEKIEKIRLEAPAIIPGEERVKKLVDDFVITFADGHRQFIQVKENLLTSGGAWENLWNDFSNQVHTDFASHDRLVLYLGTHARDFDLLMGICERACESDNALEWHKRINDRQAKIIESVQKSIEKSTPLDAEGICQLFAAVDVRTRTSAELDHDLPRWMPPNNLGGEKLVSLLRDLVADRSRFRGIITREKLDDFLRSQGVKIQSPGEQKKLLHLPPPASHFTGRQTELAQVLEGLQPGQIFVICAPGGMGKTALAAQALYQLTQNGALPPAAFPDGVFYHTFYHQPEISSALAEVARFFGVDPRPDPAQAAREALYGRCALLYLDGAEDAGDLRPLLDLRGRCAVLITTRDRKHLSLGQGLDLHPLPLEEAVNLLQSLGGDQARDDLPARQLCQQLGCHPLAVNLAGAYIGTTQEPVKSYASWLAGALESGERRHENLRLLYQRSLDRLSDPARHLLSVIGLLAFAPFETAWLAAALPQAETQVSAALGELARFSLANRSGSMAQLSHVFIHSYASEETPPAESLQTLAGFFIRFAKEQTALEETGFTALDLARPHILALLQRLEESQAWQPLLRLSYSFVDYLDLHSYSKDRLDLIQRALHASRQLQNRQGESIWLNVLGNTYFSLGEPRRAIGFYAHALKIARQTGDRRGEGDRFGNLGDAYVCRGMPYRAIWFYEQALEIARQIGDRRGEGAHLGSLGLAYANLGEPRRAIEFYEQALDIFRQIGDRHDEGTALGGLGLTYADLGELRRAIEFYEQALEIARQTGDRHGEGADLGNLGLAYADLGEPRRAIEFYEQALAIYEPMLPPDHPNIQIVRRRLVRAKEQLKQTESG